LATTLFSVLSFSSENLAATLIAEERGRTLPVGMMTLPVEMEHLRETEILLGLKETNYGGLLALENRIGSGIRWGENIIDVK
jgi:hypothetical protein